MPEFNRPNTEQEFEANFAQIKPLMSETDAFYESARCLFCYDAPCINACPTGIDIPLFIRQINAKNELGAAKTIYDSNIFGYACGKVCPTEVLCEGACVYNNSDVKPIEIGRLQSFATSQAIKQNKQLYKPGQEISKRVAIIGAGPAGISCACELRLHGVTVDIFEAKEKPSGLTVYGVAPYKITNDEALDEMTYLQKQFGFHVIYEKKIDTKRELQTLEAKYDAIFIGIGLGKTSELKIPGEDLEHVYGAIEFVERLRVNHHTVIVPNKVIVLGGGNTAMDAASESARMGASEVVLAYRRGKEEMGAYDFEYELAKQVGVQARFHVTPLEIVGNEKVEGVRFAKTQMVDGKLETISGSEFIEPCDWVIKATGQAKQTDMTGLIDGLSTNKNGTIIVDHHFQTTSPKYFSAGDAVSGGQEVVNAVANGKKAAQAIVQFIL